MNIIVDGRTLVKSSAGITTFLQGSLFAWAKSCPNDTFYLALPHCCDSSAKEIAFPANVKWIVSNNVFFKYLPNLLWLCLMTPILCRRYEINVYFSPVPCVPFFLNHSIKTVVVVHDVVNIEYKNTMEWTNRIANYLFYNRAVRKTDVLWANSHYTKECIDKYFTERKCKDIIVGCSVNRSIYKKCTISKEQEILLRKKIGIYGHFLLFVGSLEPRKNLPFLLSLMPVIYRETGMRLLVVGARGWKDSDVREIVESKDFPKEAVVFSGFISSKELALTYNIADVFVSPSLNEGFGMPQLEALLCGCPIVTAYNSAMIEVAQGKNNSILISGYEKRDWIDAIYKMSKRSHTVDESEFTEYDWNKIVTRLLARL